MAPRWGAGGGGADLLVFVSSPERFRCGEAARTSRGSIHCHVRVPSRGTGGGFGWPQNPGPFRAWWEITDCFRFIAPGPCCVQGEGRGHPLVLGGKGAWGARGAPGVNQLPFLQGVLLLQLGGHRRQAAAAERETQQDPHRGLGESLPARPSSSPEHPSSASELELGAEKPPPWGLAVGMWLETPPQDQIWGQGAGIHVLLAPFGSWATLEAI